jgi:hypothetical protein
MRVYNVVPRGRRRLGGEGRKRTRRDARQDKKVHSGAVHNEGHTREERERRAELTDDSMTQGWILSQVSKVSLYTGKLVASERGKHSERQGKTP